MTIQHVLAGITANEFDTAVRWYEQLLGRSPDARPMDGLAEWNVPGSGTIQVIHQPERAGNSLLTLRADDLRSLVAELNDRGLAVGPVDDTTSDKVLIATVDDPDGNTITLVQPRP